MCLYKAVRLQELTFCILFSSFYAGVHDVRFHSPTAITYKTSGIAPPQRSPVAAIRSSSSGNTRKELRVS